MREIIGILSTGIIIAFPVIKFYQGSNWTKKQNVIAILSVLFLWYFIQSPLHELSHIIGGKIMGVNIVAYQLLPKFWTGEFSNAWVRFDEIETNFQQLFVMTISPYIRDLIVTVIGFLILKTKQIHNYFVIGLIFSLFLLNSVFDIVSNFLGYAIMKFGDWNDISKLVGHIWTYCLGIGIMAFTIFLTYRIYVIYRKFPEK
jgi:hypothetical protein